MCCRKQPKEIARKKKKKKERHLLSCKPGRGLHLKGAEAKLYHFNFFKVNPLRREKSGV